MALLAPTSSLTVVYARTRTLSDEKHVWHSSPAIFETRTTPSWNKQSTPECQITMDLRPLPRNLLYKCLLTAIHDFRTNQILRIHEKPLDWLRASSNTRLAQDASKLQFLSTYDTACTSANQDEDPQTQHFVFIQHHFGERNYTNRMRNQAAKLTSNVGKTVSFFIRLERNSSLIVPLILMRRKALKAAVNICINTQYAVF